MNREEVPAGVAVLLTDISCAIEAAGACQSKTRSPGQVMVVMAQIMRDLTMRTQRVVPVDIESDPDFSLYPPEAGEAGPGGPNGREDCPHAMHMNREGTQCLRCGYKPKVRVKGHTQAGTPVLQTPLGEAVPEYVECTYNRCREELHGQFSRTKDDGTQGKWCHISAFTGVIPPDKVLYRRPMLLADTPDGKVEQPEPGECANCRKLTNHMDGMQREIVDAQRELYRVTHPEPVPDQPRADAHPEFQDEWREGQLMQYIETYQPLFGLMLREHGVTMLESELMETVDVCVKIAESRKAKPEPAGVSVGDLAVALHKIRAILSDFDEPWNQLEYDIDSIAKEALNGGG